MLRRIAAFVIFSMLAVSAAASVIIPQNIASKIQTKLEIRQTELASLKTAIADARHVMSEPRNPHQEAMESALFLLGGSQNTGGAHLQLAVFKIAKKHKAEVVAAELVNPARDDEGTRRSLRIHVRLSASALKGFLTDLETGRPLLVVRQFLSFYDQSYSLLDDHEPAGLLDIHMTVSGFVSLRPIT